jgi:hypothetical protein
MKIRDWDISIRVVNKDDYTKTFRPLLKDSINHEAFIDLINRMKGEALKENHSRNRFSLTQLFDLSDIKIIQKQAEFKSTVDSYITEGKLKTTHLDFDILQYLFSYTSSEYFKESFYIDLAYHPPVELSPVFANALAEINKANSKEVTFINPFLPYCEDLEEEGQIYHAIVSKHILNLTYAELQKKNSSEDEDLRYLLEVFEKGVKGQVIIFFVVTP